MLGKWINNGLFSFSLSRDAVCHVHHFSYGIEERKANFKFKMPPSVIIDIRASGRAKNWQPYILRPSECKWTGPLCAKTFGINNIAAKWFDAGENWKLSCIRVIDTFWSVFIKKFAIGSTINIESKSRRVCQCCAEWRLRSILQSNFEL